MPTFVRVAHRHGWQVDTIEGTNVVESSIRNTRAEALEYAKSLAPDWIEVGDIRGLDTPDQEHVWTTLRRQSDGTYVSSPLKWQRKASS
jgi:type IV secretory pathway ATPase VirB11/archaellum biosynthesis ATPase